jgi:amino acid transporter
VSALDWVLGRPLASEEQEHQQIGPLAAVPVLGLDAMGSAAYGPEAALTVLIPLGAVGLGYVGPILGVIVGVLLIVYFSYRQTIAAYPQGGGSYTVAKANLGKLAGLTGGAALVIDYILNVAVGIAAGVGALVSAFPTLLPYTLTLCLVILVVLTLVNLRGIRESGQAFMAPSYTFVVTLLVVTVVGVVKAIASSGHPVPVVAPPAAAAAAEGATGWILIRAFANGCTAMTGVEAVSNGVPLFRKPTIRNAQRALSAIIAVLVILLAGIGYLSRAYGIVATDPGLPGYQSLLSMLVAAVMGRGVFYYLTIGSVVAVLALSANTSFADFPRVCRALAEDRFLPDSFAIRGRRLVYSEGIVALAMLSGLLLVAFGGITDRLIPLFAIGALLAFTMSQAGMVAHWRRVGGQAANRSLLVNAAGAIATGVTVLVVAVSKFTEGAWITVIVLPLLVAAFWRVNAHYLKVAEQVADPTPLDIEAAPAPIVVVAAQSWNKMTHRGLQFAMRLSPDVYAVQVKAETAKMRDLTAEWPTLVERPALAAKLTPPRLVVLASSYRQFFQPLFEFVIDLRDKNPTRDIVVVIPDLVVAHWYQGLLHNHRGAVLRTLFRLRGGPRVVVVNTPLYLRSGRR